MKVIKNKMRPNKAVNILQSGLTIRAMYVQIYQGEEQVLKSKAFANIKNAEKWAKKVLA